jgi:hypothetical protein
MTRNQRSAIGCIIQALKIRKDSHNAHKDLALNKVRPAFLRRYRPSAAYFSEASYWKFEISFRPGQLDRELFEPKQ